MIQLLLAASAILSAASEVDDCRPCEFALSANGPKLTFTFEVRGDGDERAVAAIQVRRPGNPAVIQRLEVTKEMTPITAAEKFFFGGFDLDFDGTLDLMLVTNRGAANATAQYWRYNSRTGQFKSLGEYPVFTADTARKRLKTHERGGFGGLAYEDREFAAGNGKLILMRQVSQDTTADPDVFLRVTRERRGGAMRVVERKAIRRPE